MVGWGLTRCASGCILNVEVEMIYDTVTWFFVGWVVGLEASLIVWMVYCLVTVRDPGNGERR